MKVVSASLCSQFYVISSLLLLLVASSYACSDFLVTPGASQDGSAMIAYNADDAALYGVLYHYPATNNNTEGEMIQIYDWDSGVSAPRERKFEETYLYWISLITLFLFSSSFFDSTEISG